MTCALDVDAEGVADEVVLNPTLFNAVDVVQTAGYREQHGISQGGGVTGHRDPLQFHLYVAVPMEGSRPGSTPNSGEGSRAPESGGASNSGEGSRAPESGGASHSGKGSRVVPSDLPLRPPSDLPLWPPSDLQKSGSTPNSGGASNSGRAPESGSASNSGGALKRQKR